MERSRKKSQDAKGGHDEAGQGEESGRSFGAGADQ